MGHKRAQRDHVKTEEEKTMDKCNFRIKKIKGYGFGRVLESFVV